MFHHYLTIYVENGKLYAESWIQLNLFGWSWCFSRIKTEIKNRKKD